MREAISGNQWQSVVISGNQYSNRIRLPSRAGANEGGNQWSSVAISIPIVSDYHHTLMCFWRQVGVQIRSRVGQHSRVRPIAGHERARAEQPGNHGRQRRACADLEDRSSACILWMRIQMGREYLCRRPQPMRPALPMADQPKAQYARPCTAVGQPRVLVLRALVDRRPLTWRQLGCN